MSTLGLSDENLLQVNVAQATQKNEKSQGIATVFEDVFTQHSIELLHGSVLLGRHFRILTSEDEEHDRMFPQLPKRHDARNLVHKANERYPSVTTPAADRLV